MATITISGGDEYCRYLSAPGSDTRSFQFGKFLERLRIELPTSLREIINMGWITPVFRIRLPDSFYLNWKNYPIINKINFEDCDEWAAKFYIRCVTNHPETVNNYSHYLDRRDDPLTQQILGHAIPVGPDAVDPEPIQHPRGNQTIYPWVDLFSYWQAYELVEILQATILFSPIRDTPEAEDNIRWALKNLTDLREHTQVMVGRVKDAWEQRRQVFDWISRYRTFLAATLEDDNEWTDQEGAPQLMQQLNLTPDEMKAGIRDTLLTLWRDWKPRNGKHEVVPQIIRLHLQEDISRAVDFLRDATETNIDLDDSFWGTKSRRNQGWSPLADALPFEAFTAKSDFPVYTYHSLKNFEAPLRQKFEEDHLRELTATWWPKSAAFRRFCLALKRLHRSSDAKEGQIDLRESTPVEFITLCALLAEKILRDRILEERDQSSKSPGFTSIVLDSVRAVLRSLKTPRADIAVNQLREMIKQRAQLYDLQANPRNPFVSESEFPHSDPVTRRILSWFCNFAILRNYVAHHDVLDDELDYGSMIGDAIEALLVVVITVLDT